VNPDPGREFFEQMATCRDAYRRLADAIHATLEPCSAIDFGAGLGFVGARLGELGWATASYDPFSPRALRDLGTAWMEPPLQRKFSVVICTETAEHIAETHAEQLVSDVTWLARTILVWSAAAPGQEWPGHVNLQPPEYWLGKLSRAGFVPRTDLTAHLRAEMRQRHAQHEYAADNFYVLERT
jgi:hypothetical protein